MKKIILIIILKILIIDQLYALNYKRIISLAPIVTENIYLLGVQDRLIGITIYCNDRSDNIERIGTLWEPNIEKIVSLNPDIVIATKEGNKPETVQRLKELGINVYVLQMCKNFEDICQNLIEIGNLTDHKDQVYRIIKDANKRLNGLEKSIKKYTKKDIFLQVGNQPLITITSESFLNDFIEKSGGKNIYKYINKRYPQINREDLLRKNPDVILILKMGDETNNLIKAWQEYKTIKAVKENSIYVLDPSTYASPTPLSFVEGVYNIATLIHKEFKKEDILYQK